MRKNNSFYDIENEIYNENFDTAIQMLEGMPFDAKEVYTFHFLYGVALFNLGKTDFSYKEFRHALTLEHGDIACRLYIACIHLKNHKIDIAMSEWLSILQDDAENMFAKKAVAIFRNADKDAISEIAKNVYKVKLLPRFIPLWVRRKKRRRIVSVSILISIVLAIIPFYQTISKSIVAFFRPQNERSDYLQQLEADGALENNNAIVDNHSVYTLQEMLQFPLKETFSKRKIASLLSDVEHAFVTYQDNKAQMLINTLLYSNASNNDKQRVYVLQKSIVVPSYISKVTWFSFDDIKSELWKYNNITVKWKGTVANILSVATKDNTQLMRLSDAMKGYQQIAQANFLVNFSTVNKEISAIIPIYFLPTIRLQNGDEVELLATIKYNEPSINILSTLVEAKLNIALLVQGFRYIIN